MGTCGDNTPCRPCTNGSFPRLWGPMPLALRCCGGVVIEIHQRELRSVKWQKSWPNQVPQLRKFRVSTGAQACFGKWFGPLNPMRKPYWGALYGAWIWRSTLLVHCWWGPSRAWEPKEQQVRSKAVQEGTRSSGDVSFLLGSQMSGIFNGCSCDKSGLGTLWRRMRFISSKI